MCVLLHTVPQNIEEQERLFFESDCTINPQFEYDNFDLTQKFLQTYSKPSEELMPIAVKIMDSFIKKFGSETAYLESEGDIVTPEETESLFMDYICELEF